MKVAILGAGSFGTALAQVFATQGPKVAVWTRSDEVALHINEYHSHPHRFREIKLKSRIQATTDLEETLRGAHIVVSALPMKALRDTASACAALLDERAIFLSTSKGIEPDTLMFPNEVLLDALSNFDHRRLVFLSGPNFASEIIRGLPWAAVAASSSKEAAKGIQNALSAANVRVYYSSDVIGVEIGGALKNVFAIASGIVDGLELGRNARAALMTRALNEMTKFSMALNAETKTIYGLAGLGDLLLTCTSAQSRNWRVGHGLALGKSLGEIEAEMGEVAEGVSTTRAAVKLARRLGLDTPICESVNRVLFEGVGVKEAILDLMGRSADEE